MDPEDYTHDERDQLWAEDMAGRSEEYHEMSRVEHIKELEGILKMLE